MKQETVDDMTQDGADDLSDEKSGDWDIDSRFIDAYGTDEMKTIVVMSNRL